MFACNCNLLVLLFCVVNRAIHTKPFTRLRSSLRERSLLLLRSFRVRNAAKLPSSLSFLRLTVRRFHRAVKTHNNPVKSPSWKAETRFCSGQQISSAPSREGAITSTLGSEVKLYKQAPRLVISVLPIAWNLMTLSPLETE